MRAERGIKADLLVMTEQEWEDVLSLKRETGDVRLFSKCVICRGPIDQCPHGSTKPTVQMKDELFVTMFDDLGKSPGED